MKRTASHLLLTTGIVLIAWPAAFPARTLDAQLVETPTGTVQFIGLEQWSSQMILDSLATRAPGAPSPQWVGALQDLGFPRAAVNQLSVQGVGAVTLVTVVEPHRADRIRPRDTFGAPGTLPPEWEELARTAELENPAFQSAVSLRWFREMDGGIPGFFLENLEASDQRLAVDRFWDLLDARVTPEDLATGLRILREDGNTGNRAVAAAVVSGFPEEEAAWIGLMEALRDARGPVNSTASQALASMLTLRPRAVDWAPASEGVSALLAGTNIPAFSVAVQTLVATEISPALAPAILPGSEHLLLAHLDAVHSPYHAPVHRLLVRLRGEDLGTDPEPWARWIDELR